MDNWLRRQASGPVMSHYLDFMQLDKFHARVSSYLAQGNTDWWFFLDVFAWISVQALFHGMTATFF